MSAAAHRIIDMYGRPARRSKSVEPRAYYEATQWTRERTNLSLGPDDVNECIAQSRLELLRKAQYWDRNSPLVNRLADLFTNHVVGTGLRVVPSSSDPVWNAAATEWWSQWEQVADLTSRFPWPVLQRLMARELMVAGEYFIVLTNSPDSGRDRIQFVQPYQVSTPTERVRDPRVIDGVEVNEWGRPVAYFIRQMNEGSKAVWRRVEARWVVHGYEPQRPSQVRGVTMFSPVLNDIHDLEDLQKLEQQAARANAQITRVIKTESGEVDDEEAMVTGESVSAEDRTTYYRKVFGSSAEVMMTGDDMQEFRSDRPSVAVREYWIWLVNKICAGVNIPSQLVFPESLNGTVTRAVLDLANSHFRGYTLMISASVQRVWNYAVGNSPDLAPLPPDFGRISVYPPRGVNVDVGRNSTAMINEYRAGMRTLEGIYAETGQDWREELAQKAAELVAARELAEANGLKSSDLLESIEPEEPGVIIAED